MVPQTKPTLMAGLASIVLCLIVDQTSKAIILANSAALSAGIPVFPGFNLVIVRNEGVTFGLLGGVPWWSLVALAIAICCWLAVLLFRTPSRIEAAALGAIIGGALGNVADRLQYRAVTDFLDFYIGSAHWPTFNMADVFVVCGLAALLLAPVLPTARMRKD